MIKKTLWYTLDNITELIYYHDINNIHQLRHVIEDFLEEIVGEKLIVQHISRQTFHIPLLQTNITFIREKDDIDRKFYFKDGKFYTHYNLLFPFGLEDSERLIHNEISEIVNKYELVNVIKAIRLLEENKILRNLLKIHLNTTLKLIDSILNTIENGNSTLKLGYVNNKIKLL
ncbi:MAG: Unknown protein [uncultured Sulfurovum sp.]|uniref:Uncharacterized protein n=1 Tax=uncultured Sulfurovum sp. TaxID=269237 RepID=A0A6S6S9J8_9BACT|nr:MAG: Unknown protein [uncultured Sulfurovum sp.]